MAWFSRKTDASLPSSPEPSSTAHRCKYHVYLSFSGVDTRKGFTSHLYNWLKSRGIRTFKEDSDLSQGGLSISGGLLKAIEESRFAIVVLSRSYAASAWRLEELTKICELMEDDGQRILPVFYDVDPTDLRFQRGRDFTRHEQLYGAEKVNQWRETLRKVSCLSGWLAHDHRTEIELLDSIADFVCSEIYTVGFEVFEATRRAMDEVTKALNDEDVTAIGVYGVGGVGKTTMIKHISAEVQNNGMFHHVIKAVVSKIPDLRKIQGTLADMLSIELDEETEMGRSRRLMQKIRRGNRILIILDDIWDKIDLSNIGIPSYHELQKCKSKVLFTTRTQNVCCDMECQSNIFLDVLSVADSWTLFLNRARMCNDYNVARKVALECAGLPIALIAVAKVLGDKNDWREIARRLKASQPADADDGKVVFNCIKLSYDYLSSDDARSCFLLCCLFPEDYDIQIEDLLKYGMGKGLFQDSSTIQDARASVQSVVKYLRDCSLLLESERDGCVKMHNIIRDVAIRISSSEGGQLFFVQAGCQLKEWPRICEPEGYSAISLIRNKICKLPEELVCSKLLILLLQSNVCLHEIPKDFFRSLNKLRVLDLSRTRISLLPISFDILINLHTLYLDGCLSMINNISVLGKLKSLEILSMRDLPLVEVPKEIAHLTNLRMLDITGEYVDAVPSEVICNLHRLEELYMQCNFADWRSEVGRNEVDGSKVEGSREETIAAFDELTSLSHLNILKVFISDAKCLPKDLEVEPNWVNFDICISSSLSIRKVSLVPNSSPVYTRDLTLGTTINALPGWFINVVTTKAEKLQYIMCWGLDNLLVEYECGRLHGLKYFSVIGPSENLKVLMNTAALVQKEPVFQNLEELHLVQVDCLKELCFGELPPGSLCNLRLLKVQHCYKLVDALLPSQLLQRLQNLEKLICEEIDELEYVFGCEGLKLEQIILTELKEMRLENLGKLINIWNGPAPCTIFQNLHTLVVSGCFELENLFTTDVAQCLLQLGDLSVECCPLLDKIIEASKETMDTKIVFPKLKNLALIKLPQLTRFYGDSECAVECPLLEYLNVERCPRFSKSDFTAGTSNSVINSIGALFKEASRNDQMVSALTRTELQDGYVAYPWERRMQELLPIPNSSSFLSVLFLPMASDHRASCYNDLDDTFARANVWLNASQASGVPIVFLNIQTESLLTKISGETVNAGSISDLANLASASSYGFEDHREVDIGVVRAVRLWYAPLGPEIPVEIKLQEGDVKLGFAISRTDEGFIYVSSVADGDEHAPSTRSGLSNLYKEAMNASRLLVVSRVSNQKVLPWAVSSTGIVRCYDIVSLSQKLSLHRHAKIPVSIHVFSLGQSIGSFIYKPK